MFRPYVPDVAGFIEKGDRPDQSCVCTGKIRHPGYSTLLDEFKYTRSLVPESQREDVKLTMISPVWYHLRYRQGQAYPADVYANDEEYLADVAEAYRVELDILYEAGVRNVQIDDPLFACEFVTVHACLLKSSASVVENQGLMICDSLDFCSQPMIDGYAADDSNTRPLDELLDLYIQCYNDCLSQHSSRIHFGLHICRGKQ